MTRFPFPLILFFTALLIYVIALLAIPQFRYHMGCYLNGYQPACEKIEESIR
jgi:hypothetical protein